MKRFVLISFLIIGIFVSNLTAQTYPTTVNIPTNPKLNSVHKFTVDKKGMPYVAWNIVGPVDGYEVYKDAACTITFAEADYSNANNTIDFIYVKFIKLGNFQIKSRVYAADPANCSDEDLNTYVMNCTVEANDFRLNMSVQINGNDVETACAKYDITDLFLQDISVKITKTGGAVGDWFVKLKYRINNGAWIESSATLTSPEADPASLEQTVSGSLFIELPFKRKVDNSVSTDYIIEFAIVSANDKFKSPVLDPDSSHIHSKIVTIHRLPANHTMSYE